MESILSKEKFKDCFDAAFVSARAAQTLGSVSFDGVMKDNSIIAVENAKFMIPLSKSERETVNLKIDELASSHGWRKSEGTAVSTFIYNDILMPLMICSGTGTAKTAG